MWKKLPSWRPGGSRRRRERGGQSACRRAGRGRAKGEQRMREHSILAGAQRLRLEDGSELRLLSALEVLEARREAEELAKSAGEQALCSNACLLARALERDGEPLFEDGWAVLRGMTASEIAVLATRWADFERQEDPAPEDGEERCRQLKKAWSTRRRSACAGVCSRPSELCPPRRACGK